MFNLHIKAENKFIPLIYNVFLFISICLQIFNINKMGTIRNICETLLRLYNSNINGGNLNRLHLYYPYFKDISEHNFGVRSTNYNNNNSLVQAYLNPIENQLIFRFVDSQARCIPNGTLASNPGLTVHSNIVHVFGAHEAPHGTVGDWVDSWN